MTAMAADPDGQWPYCSGCTRDTLPDPAPSVVRFLGIGVLYGPAAGGVCPRCGSEARRLFVCVFWVPLIPLRRYRLQRLPRRQYVGRRMPSRSDAAALEAGLSRADAAVAARTAALAAVPAGHPDLAGAHARLAEALLAAGRVRDAAIELEAAADAHEARHGPTAEPTLRTLEELAGVLASCGPSPRNRGTLDGAADGLWITRLVAGRRQLDLWPEGPEPLSPAATRAVNERAWSHEPTIARHAQLVDVRTAQEGADGVHTLRLRHSLAAELALAARLDESIRVFEDTLAARTRVLGPDHPDTAGTRRELLTVCAAAVGRTHDPRHPQFAAAAAAARQRLQDDDLR